MRLIDADSISLKDIPMDMGGLVYIEDVLLKIEELPTVEVPGWISVKDRLPEPFVPVLGYMPKRISDNIEILYRTKTELWNSQEHGDCFFGTPSHWMPLPEPPEVEE